MPKTDRRPARRKVNLLRREGVTRVDWTDVTLLRKFISDRGKIRSRRVTGLTPQEQREVATAIKNAREMALLPYPGPSQR
jgi:small subunit ribosomal protein S18